MIKEILQFLQSIDRNGMYLEMHEDLINEGITLNEVIEYLQGLFDEWRFDLIDSGYMTNRVKSYYKFLGIKY
jgi:hypothetical protein